VRPVRAALAARVQFPKLCPEAALLQTGRAIGWQARADEHAGRQPAGWRIAGKSGPAPL
jgi:hypothetical protein